MSESKGAMRAVDAMVDAIHADEPPALQWDAIERSLLRRIQQGEGARPTARPSSGLWRVLSFAAAAAIVPIALSLGAPSQSTVAVEEIRTVDVAAVASAPGDVGAQSGDAGARDLGALHRGDAVEASAAAVTFADSGKVRWTLSPDSRLVVRSPVPESGIGHVVRLERGSLRVEVQPDLVRQGLVDVLAVEVGNTRVAVHGTAFTVSLRNGEVVVDVEHGVVTVGPTGQLGATTGYQLPAGSRAAFSLDGGRNARWLPREAPVVTDPIAAVAGNARAVVALAEPVADPNVNDDVPAMMDPPPAVAVKLAAGAKSAPANNDADKPSGDAGSATVVAVEAPAKPTLTSGAVLAGLKRCFAQAHPTSDGAKLTASSTFTLSINPDGSIGGAQFSPPLPSIQGCAAFVYGGKFAPAGAKYVVTIPVSLSQ